MYEDEREEKRAEAKRAEEKRVRVAQQFREKLNMAYDLDCSGTPLIVRVFAAEASPSGDRWRIEARTTDAKDAVVASASAETRAKALIEVAEWWRSKSTALGLPTFDWDAIALALNGVRAL